MQVRGRIFQPRLVDGTASTARYRVLREVAYAWVTVDPTSIKVRDEAVESDAECVEFNSYMAHGVLPGSLFPVGADIIVSAGILVLHFEHTPHELQE